LLKTTIVAASNLQNPLSTVDDSEKDRARREMLRLVFLMQLTRLLVAATVYISESNVDKSMSVTDVATEPRTEASDWKLLKTTTTSRMMIFEAATTTAAHGQQSTGVTLPVDGEPQSEQSLDDRFDEVDMGQHMMEQFYQRYNTTAQVDLVFVLDRSGSVPQNGWKSIVEFVKVCEVYLVWQAVNTSVVCSGYACTVLIVYLCVYNVILVKIVHAFASSRSTQPGHPSVGRRNEYRSKGGDALRLGSKG